jgi:hypothetical protein
LLYVVLQQNRIHAAVYVLDHAVDDLDAHTGSVT